MNDKENINSDMDNTRDDVYNEDALNGIYDDDIEDDTYDDEDDIIEYEIYCERRRRRRKIIICGIISLILIVLSPVINALLASALCSSPKFVFIPFVAIAVMVVYTLSIMHKKRLAHMIALIAFPLVIATIAGSLFYTYIRQTDYFHNGIAKYTNTSGKEGAINCFGFSVINPDYTYINITDNALMVAQRDSLKGVISNNGDVVIPLKYKYITELMIDSISPSYVYKVTTFAGRTGLIADSGKPIIPCVYDDLLYWNTDPVNKTALFTASLNNCKGIINQLGTVIEPCKYFEINDIKDGLAKVNVGGQLADSIVIGGYWGYVNRSGTEVIPCRFDTLGEVDEQGIITATDGIHTFTYNKNGDILDMKN